jgi:8-oxo-dGTP pyrophosphatase MutT (NUDIX family)
LFTDIIDKVSIDREREKAVADHGVILPSPSSHLNFKVRHWTTINKELVADCRVFTVHKQISQRTTEGVSETHDFFVFKPTDWVNVVAVTPDYQVVLIEQYRHGIEQVTLEIPGGMIDAEDASSLIAGERELLEETGCSGEALIFLGRNHPNPAIQSNICDTYLTLNVKQTHIPSFDSTEEVAIRLVPIKDIPSLIKNGMITHALVIVAFHYLQQYCLENVSQNPEIDKLNPFS